MGKVFDLESFAASSGAKIVGANEDGTVNMSVIGDDGNEVTRVFDAPAFLKSKGVNPTDVELKVNSPDTSFDENALGFSSAIKFSLGRTKEDKMAVLVSDYGADNVAQGSDGSFKVKEKGAWKNADPSFLQNIGSVLPEMGASIAGTAAGAKVGAGIGAAIGGAVGAPVFGVGALAGIGVGAEIGSVVGGLTGGALSAAVAKWGKEEVAEKLNLRTEADGAQALDEVKKEFIHNMIWDTALLGAGKALKPVAKAAGKVVSRTADIFFDKETMAKTAAKLFPGTFADDWATVVKSSDDAGKVMTDLKKVVEYNQKSLNGATKEVLDPATREMNNLAVGSVKQWHAIASKNYKTNLEVLEKGGAFNSKVQAAPILSQFGEALDDLGLRHINPSTGKLEFVPNAEMAADSAAKSLMDPKALNSLRKVYDILEHAAGWEGKAAGQRVFDPHLQKHVFKSKPQGMLDFKSAKQLLDGIDDILDVSGYYKGGDMAIGSGARRILKETRSSLRKALGESIPEKAVVSVNGKAVSQRELYEQTMKGWHNFRKNYDDFALPSKFGGGDSSAIQATIQRMLGKKGAGLEETFGSLANAVGAEASPALNRLKQLRAAKNLSEVYASNTGWGAIVARPVLGGPRDHAARMAWASQKFEQGAAAKQMPISRGTVTAMQSLAKGATWLNDIGIENKMKLLSSPDMLRQFTEAILNAPSVEEAQTQQLIRKAQGGQ